MWQAAAAAVAVDAEAAGSQQGVEGRDRAVTGALDAAQAARKWQEVRSALRPGGGAGGGSERLQREKEEHERKEASLAAEREKSAAVRTTLPAHEYYGSPQKPSGGGGAAATSAAPAAVAAGSSPAAGGASPRGIPIPASGGQRRSLEAEQRARERKQFSASRAEELAADADTPKVSKALQALREGRSSKMDLCDLCQKKMYPTETVNIDGYRVHDNPCGRCVGREGLRCGNKASRSVRDGDQMLLLCNAHFRQRQTETGVVAPKIGGL